MITRSASNVGERVVQQAMAHADELGATSRAAVMEGSSPAEEILRLVQEIEADLVVMGANLRRVGGQAVLGPPC